MTVSKDLETLQPEPKFPEIVFPPGDLESQELPLESYLHLQQLLLLLKCLDWLWQERTDYFAAGNLTIYYSPEQKKSQDFRGPDFFVVLDTERKPRKSWVVWEEGGKYPNLIIELLSNSTANVDEVTAAPGACIRENCDRTEKKKIYQDIFRTPEYFWFSPDTLEFQGFHIVDGDYETLHPNEQGRLWSKQLQLFIGIYEQKLRFFTVEGELVPTPEESAKTTQEQLNAEQERNQRLAAKLRELGINPETV